MQDPEIHPEDAAAMREGERHAGPLRQQACERRRHASTSSTSARDRPVARAYLVPDIVVLVLNGGYTAAEATLFEAGKWHDVRQGRMNWQDSMEVRFVETIEQLTGRTVRAFMSANHQDPDVSVELFLLDGPAPTSAAA
jgi:uncharacterized protein YbcI